MKKKEAKNKKKFVASKFLLKFGPIVFLFLPLIIFFYPVWMHGKNPIPADTLTGLYHPYRDAVAEDYPNGTPYKNFLITDAVRQQYLYRQFSIDQLKQGELPWWNPYNFSGTPHLAGFQAATFNPLNLVYVVFNFLVGWNIQVVGQMFLGALFMYWYLRSLKLRQESALFGALTWVFSGFFVVWLEWNTAVWVGVWAPLVLLCLDKIFMVQKKAESNSQAARDKLQATRFGWSILLMFALVAQFYAGYPQPWLYLSLVQVSYGLWRFVSNLGDVRHLRKSVFYIVVPYLFFGLLAFPQLKATLDFSSLSNRVADQGNLLEKEDWFIPYPQLVQSVVPDFFGNPATLNYWGVFNYTEFVTFIGVIPAFFVIFSISNRKKRKPETWFFLSFIVLALLLSLRNPISELQFKLDLPFIGGSQPSRWIIVIDLSLAILAAFGLDRWMKLKKKSIPWIPVAILASVIAGLWMLVLSPEILSWNKLAENLSVAKRNLLLPTMELGTLLILLAIFESKYFRSLKKPKRLFALAIVGVSTLVGLRFGWKYTPFTDSAFLYPETKTTTFLQENLGLHRYMTTDRRIMAPNTNMAYELYTIEGYDPLYLEDYGALLTSAIENQSVEDSKAFNRILALDNYKPGYLDLLGVKYILSLTPIDDENLELVLEEGETKIYQNNRAYPKAIVLESLDDIPPLDYIEAEVISYSPNQVIVKASTDSAAFVVLNDTWYPDWNASIDGVEVEVINWHGLRATILPEGEHEIIYQYRHSYL